MNPKVPMDVIRAQKIKTARASNLVKTGEVKIVKTAHTRKG